jgi:dethiobiotin synthetase
MSQGLTRLLSCLFLLLLPMTIPNALLIAATDTDAGKTLLTSALAAYWQTYHPAQSLGIFKPIQTGTGDRELYQRLFDLGQTLEQLNPLHFAAPLAPPVAADRQGQRVDLGGLWPPFDALRQSRAFVLVEALGGLGAPLTAETTVADLARDWRLPTVLVVPVRLGAIGQAVAHVALARQSKITLKGIVLNCCQPCTEQQIADWAAPDLMQSLTKTPILGTIPYLSDPTDLTQLARAASDLNLEYLLPAAGRSLSLA